MYTPIVGISIIIHLIVIVLFNILLLFKKLTGRFLVSKTFSLVIIVAVGGAILLSGIFLIQSSLNEDNNFAYVARAYKNFNVNKSEKKAESTILVEKQKSTIEINQAKASLKE